MNSVHDLQKLNDFKNNRRSVERRIYAIVLWSMKKISSSRGTEPTMRWCWRHAQTNLITKPPALKIEIFDAELYSSWHKKRNIVLQVWEKVMRTEQFLSKRPLGAGLHLIKLRCQFSTINTLALNKSCKLLTETLSLCIPAKY